MGKFKSKKSRNTTGRPAGEHADFTVEEKREYNRVQKAASRSRASATSPQPPSLCDKEPRAPSTPRKSVGRPPLNDIAMTPNRR